MNLSKKQYVGLFLALTFFASFFLVFIGILLTQSAYSSPSSRLSIINEMDITMGPPPNSTNIPLDTTITVDTLATASLSDLHVVPEVNFASITSGTTGPLTYRTTFYPDAMLKTSTLYNVSVTIMGTPVSWSFTTTAQPFHPGISYLLATNRLWIALAVAASTAAIVGFVLWLKGKKKAE